MLTMLIYTNKLKKSALTKVVIQLVATVGLIVSCQEPYFNNDLDATEKIPVFNGIISNIDNINTFELSYAKPYTNQREDKISGAIISISDEQNQEILLQEVSEGEYKLPPDYTIEFNNKYTANISLKDGTVLKSEPTYFYDTLPIDKVFFDFNIKTSVIKTSDGNFTNVTEEGILIQFSLKQPTNEQVYYRANANYYVHSEKMISRTREITRFTDNYTITYEIKYDTLYDIYEGVTNTDFPIIGKLKPHINYDHSDLIINPLFLPADKECRNFTKYTTNKFIEWVVPIDLYRTTPEVFDYYTNAADQLNPSGQIFDPIPEQIVGNMYNETHPAKVVLGLFDATSVTRRYIAVYVHVSLGYYSYRSRILTDTVIKQGWYPRFTTVDTVSVDSIPIQTLLK